VTVASGAAAGRREATDETEVLAALARGDSHAALAVLMELYGRAVYGYCRHVVGEADLAQDVLQTTFLQAYEDLPRFASRSSLRAWLFGIARHRCLDMLKSLRRRLRRFTRLDDEVSDVVGSAPALDASDQALLARTLAFCLQRLAPRVRAAVVLRYQNEFSYPEMAEICGEAPATLQARVTRALPLLRQCIERRGIAR
jgi:RNA polymerase sigma-70 factor (ECF subfamily)